MINHQKIIKAMRAVAVDAINQAGQGHIGMAIGAAPITYSLIGQNLNINKNDPTWINRDRFVLSAGHGSMSQYSIMHFLGLLTTEDLKNHKQYGSKTPSHPEIDQFPFVDATTGPLGQGIAMAVGMAISQKYLQNHFNKPDYSLINHHIFALHGDGCLQEGVALEAIQLAGTLKLNKLILIHDYNNVQIDSTSDQVNNIDLIAFFKANKFATIVVEKSDSELINAAIKKAKENDLPTYIQVKSEIAFGTKWANKSQGHNGVLNPEETTLFKSNLGLPKAAPFVYEKALYEDGNKLWESKDEVYQKWQNLAKDYQQKFPNEYQQLQDLYAKKLAFNVLDCQLTEKDVATRNYLKPIMASLEKNINLIGGSADLAAATNVKFAKSLREGGKNIQYGIREFAMSAINNGIYLHSHLRTIASTFLVFADYAKPALRLGALQEIPSIHIFTHDSYQVGGDGPTHQPFDQLPMLRAMANMKVLRPADGAELRGAMQYALNSQTEQVAIILCRQPVKSFDLVTELPSAYAITKVEQFDVSILASGSEVELAMASAAKLAEQNIKAQVISVPILQDLIKDQKLIKDLKIDAKPIFALEASSDSMWYQLATYNKFAGHFAHSFGASAPGPEVYDKKGFNVENITNKIKNLLSN